MSEPFSGPERLFVYGTLRSDIFHPGPPNWALTLLESSADLEGPASVPGRLFMAGRYPGFSEIGEGMVKGQVWLVREPSVFKKLDEYEGRRYQRQPHGVTLEDGRRVTAWLYRCFNPDGVVSPIASGDYLDWVREHTTP